MVPELEKPRVTEIKVRMDCNGCIQKIKKALYGINGIYDLYIDFPQQKLTIIGWADPEKIVKAIKKTRKIATICSHTEQTQEPPPPTEPPAPQEGNTNASEPPPQPQPPHEGANPPPPESTPPEPPPPSEPPKDQPPTENPQPEPQPFPVDAGHPAASGPKDVGEVHVIYHHPPDYGYRYGYSHHGHNGYSHHGHNGYWNKYHHYGQGPPPEGPVPVPRVPPPVPLHPPPPPPPTSQQHPQPPPQPQPLPQQPVYVTHSYNAYRAAPYVTEYAEYVRSPPRPYPHYYSRTDSYYNNYDQDQNQYYYYNHGSSSSNGNITSIFSDENPNACRIV